MAVYEMKFMLEWMADTCVWSTNDNAREKYEYPVLIDGLPIPDELKGELKHLIDKRNDALNWDCPSEGLVWSNEQVEDFKKEALNAYNKLCEALSDEYYVELWENALI